MNFIKKAWLKHQITKISKFVLKVSTTRVDVEKMVGATYNIIGKIPDIIHYLEEHFGDEMLYVCNRLKGLAGLGDSFDGFNNTSSKAQWLEVCIVLSQMYSILGALGQELINMVNGKDKDVKTAINYIDKLVSPDIKVYTDAINAIKSKVGPKKAKRARKRKTKATKHTTKDVVDKAKAEEDIKKTIKRTLGDL